MDTASAGFHAYSANAGLAGCQGCHGVNLDGVGGSATTSCATCHGATWRTSCLMCHGGIANTDRRAALRYVGPRDGSAAGRRAHRARDLDHDEGRVRLHRVPREAHGRARRGAHGRLDRHRDLGRPGEDRGREPELGSRDRHLRQHLLPRKLLGDVRLYDWDWGSESLVEVTVPYSGAQGTPSWSATGLTCTSCHGNPPANYDWHSGARRRHELRSLPSGRERRRHCLDRSCQARERRRRCRRGIQSVLLQLPLTGRARLGRLRMFGGSTRRHGRRLLERHDYCPSPRNSVLGDFDRDRRAPGTDPGGANVERAPAFGRVRNGDSRHLLFRWPRPSPRSGTAASRSRSPPPGRQPERPGSPP